MRVSAFLLPLFSILAGIGGFLFRRSEHINVFDVITGLPVRDAPVFGLAIYSLIFVIIVVVFAVRASIKHKALDGFESAFGTDPLLYPVIFVLIGMLWIAGTYLHFANIAGNREISVDDILFITFSALSAISVTFFAIEMYQDSRRNAPYALSVVPTLFLCFWLILVFRDNSTNPTLISYSYQSLAIVASALGFYFTAGFLYGKPAPGRAIFAYNSAIFFSIITLADDHSFGITLLIYAIISANVVYSVMLIRNLQRK